MTISPERKKRLMPVGFDYENVRMRVTFLPPEGRSMRPTKKMQVEFPSWLHEEITWVAERYGLTPEGVVVWWMMDAIEHPGHEEES